MFRLNLTLKNLLYPIPTRWILLIYLILSREHILKVVSILIVIVCSTQLLLRIILKHKDLILETRGKKTTFKTKIFQRILLLFQHINPPSFMTFQKFLPRLNLPCLDETINRYLNSVRPLLSDDNYAKALHDASEFKNGVGKSLQKKLLIKSWLSDNYVSDWWEENHYLTSRDSLMYGTNIYMSDAINSQKHLQSARAANLISVILRYRKGIQEQLLEPIKLRDTVPICVWQYERLFNTTRIPEIEKDQIVHHESSEHIVVLHKGIFYKMMVNEMNPTELEFQLNQILNKKVAEISHESFIPALTSLNRTQWAEIRNKFFSRGVNKKSLEIIESSAFVVALDDEPYIFDLSSSRNEYGDYGKQLLVGNGRNRWFDKSFNLCIGKNGKSGLHCEHTWGDGNVVSNFFQECLIDDFYSYDKNGNLNQGGELVQKLSPVKLEWDLTDSTLQNSLKVAYENAVDFIKNVDHQIVVHKTFSKGLMKKFKVSPDAFIQMAIQLAYYRQHKKFSLTYEPAMSRLFLKGRTETIRSCTIESSKWVLSMDDDAAVKDRFMLFREACKKHQTLYLDAMFGYGVDRHLFCLKVAADQSSINSTFLNDACKMPFITLTSHIPHNQTKKAVKASAEFFISAGGGFPPGVHYGYSISYFPFNDDILFLHVSSLKSCQSTDTTNLLSGIIKALADIKELCEMSNT